jgi:hypothetical protein
MSKRSRKRPASARKPRPKLPLVSEEMKAWSAALGDEVGTWPKVSCRPMFGFSALYRGKKIFAVLPRTRGLTSSSSLAFKLPHVGRRVLARLRADTRISSTILQATQWFVFELNSDRHLNDALDWLGRAYDAAR